MNNLEALKTIKEECKKHGGFCSNCPFGDENNTCKIEEHYPCHWTLREESEIIRYFE